MIRVLASIVVLLALNSAASAQLEKAPPEKLRPGRFSRCRKRLRRSQRPSKSPFVYSPWTKFCSKDANDPQARPVQALQERRADGRARGRLLGVGLACYTEYTGIGSETYRQRGMSDMPGHEAARVAMASSAVETAPA